MFRLAFEDGSLRVLPHFPTLKESNVRKGFLVHDQYSQLREAHPDYLKPVLAMGYVTGMRQGEILLLRWEQVNFQDSQVLLDPGTPKMSRASFRSRASCGPSLKCNVIATNWSARNVRWSSSTGEERLECFERYGGTPVSV